jgi:hypothetical protein
MRYYRVIARGADGRQAMAAEPLRVRLEPDTDLRHVLEDVHRDGVPRVIERDGEDLAIIMPADEGSTTKPEPKSRQYKDELLALAGVWSDIDADRMIEDIYRWRHEAPPSPPVEL